MNTLLIFFAFPVAVIILSAIFETIINCPFKIAGITFAIFLVITFAFFDETFLIATIVYTILAFLVAVLVSAILNYIGNNNGNEDDENESSCMCNGRNIRLSLDEDKESKIPYCNYRKYRC